MGVVASLRPVFPTTSGMALQCPGCRHDGGDDCAGLMVTEGTRLTDPTSRHGPCECGTGVHAPSRVLPSSFEGAACDAPGF
jgi:hypothetical protein